MAGTLLNRLQPLFHTPTPPTLGPGPRAHVQSASALRGAVEELAREQGLPDEQRDLILAIALLWHDQLDASHRLVQDIPSAEGSFVHAIMHRREPDYWNSKYWWRRVGDHPVFGPLGERVAERLAGEETALAARLVPGGIWQPAAFVDECQRLADAAEDDPEHALARDLQQLEFNALLEHVCG